MRHSELGDAVRHFAQEAAALLAADLREGADLPFEVEAVPSSGRGPVLYRYRAHTGVFVEARWSRIRTLEGYEHAARALGSHAATYLRHRALGGSGPDAVLRDLMRRLFENATSFDLPEERLERLCAELNAIAAEGAATAMVVAPLHGVRISRPRVELGGGLALLRRSAIESAPVPLEGAVHAPEATAQAAGAAAPPEPSPLDVFCVLRGELPVDAPLPVDDARTAFRRALTALRLCGAGGSALGSLGWARADRGAWHPVALGVSGRARPDTWELRHADESELRELLAILARSRHDRRIAWALDRFEMGCERGLEAEALCDYLLAVRALLGEPGGGGPNGAIALRLAVLCAPGDERERVRGSVESALALEREMVYGNGALGGALALDPPGAVIREVAEHLRALLRDVLCGYLDADLRGAADAVLGAQSGESSPDEADTEEFEAVDLDDARGEVAPATGAREEDLVLAGVTASADWEAGTDDDPEDWSAPA